MPDSSPHGESPPSVMVTFKLATTTLLSFIVASACAPPAAAPPETAATAPDNGSTPAVERPAPPSPFNDRACTRTSEPAATGMSTPQRTCSLQLAAATLQTTQFRFHDGNSPLELRFDADSVTFLDGIGEAAGSIQGVRESDPCWQAIARYTLTPHSDSPLALQAVDFELRWCSGVSGLTLIRTAATSVGSRRQTVHVAD